MGTRRGSPKLLDGVAGLLNVERVYYQVDAEDRESGLNYYARFQARVMGCEPEMDKVCAAWSIDKSARVKAGVYAALSPNNSEESALRDLTAALTAYREDAWDALGVHTYGPNKAKALRILQGEDPDVVLGGPKTRNFYHNILDPGDPDYITIDGHMVNVWNGQRVPLDFAGISEKGYAQLADGYRLFARLCFLSPSQLQSIIWITWRRINKILYNAQRNLFDATDLIGHRHAWEETEDKTELICHECGKRSLF